MGKNSQTRGQGFGGDTQKKIVKPYFGNTQKEIREPYDDNMSKSGPLCTQTFFTKTPMVSLLSLVSPSSLVVTVRPCYSDDNMSKRGPLCTQTFFTETPPMVSPSSLGVFEASQEYKTKLYDDMPKLWANAYTRALILLHIAKTDRDAFAALRPQQDDTSFTPETISAAFQDTQNPSHHQYVLAATLTLILEGDLPALGDFKEPAAEQQKLIRQRVLDHNQKANETNTTTIKTPSDGEKEKPEIPPLNDEYKVRPETYTPYNAALQVLRSDPSKTLTDKEIEEIADEKPNRKNQILQVLAPIARNKDAWQNDELQQRPLTNRLRQADIVGFISYACVLLGLESQEDQEDYAKVVAQQMGYEVGHTFRPNDLAVVRPEHQAKLEALINEGGYLWDGGSTPNFTRATLAALQTTLHPKEWQQVADLYKPRTLSQYLGPKQEETRNQFRLHATKSVEIWNLMAGFQEENLLTNEQVNEICTQTVYREESVVR
jgi:hypothetical protein